MWDRVTVVQGPPTLPIGVDAMKQRVRVDFADDDTVIEAMIRDAVRRIDGPKGIGIAMMQQTWRYALDGLSAEIVLPGWPVKSVTAIRYLDGDHVEQTVPADRYRLVLDINPARIVLSRGHSWPATASTRAAARIDYVLGEANPADVHEDLISAVCLYTGYRYEHREAAGEGAIAELPMSVQHILHEHQQAWVAA